jgi:hypothetical protein
MALTSELTPRGRIEWETLSNKNKNKEEEN